MEGCLLPDSEDAWLASIFTMKLSSVAALASLLVPAGTMPSQQHSPSKKSPNFLFILTDDLDYQLNSPAYLPSTLSRVKDKGVELANHFVTTALCCPSRVCLWTGRQAHNTNVTDVDPPWGEQTLSMTSGTPCGY